MISQPFKIHSKYHPAGDQISAIEKLSQNISQEHQVLLGVTGSGKTYTMAHVIEQTQKPAIIMAHNKILAAQLYNEMKGFFPENAVEYFISYFDYYQPEAYVAGSDTYIDKDSIINSKLEQMKLSAVYSLLERRDCIVVCSVSSIYGIQSREHYVNSLLHIKIGDYISINNLTIKLAKMHYTRNDIEFERATFRVKGDIVDIFSAHSENQALRISFFGDEIEELSVFDPVSGKITSKITSFKLYASYLFATPENIIQKAIPGIEKELEEQIKFFEKNNKLIEAQRIAERTKFDIEMLLSTGHCKGIENYARYLNNDNIVNKTPSTIFDYLADDAILFVDESHVSIPQIRAMYKGDYSRKKTLAEYGFRLPSCVDNRPLKFEEWFDKKPNTIFVSATPGDYELSLTSGQVVEQIIRPTGLLDPICIVRPATNQLDDLINEIELVVKNNLRVLAVTLTKKMAMRISEYLNEHGFKVKYMHSDIDSFERIEIIKSLRLGKFDVLVGINLLREGLDIPECGLVAILDADKEGFLRSKTSLIQTIGRAARNKDGKVILYADHMTRSLHDAIQETERRRKIQEQWNLENNITPTTIISNSGQFDSFFVDLPNDDLNNKIQDLSSLSLTELEKMKQNLNKQMRKLARNLEFEQALEIREQITLIDEQIIQI